MRLVKLDGNEVVIAHVQGRFYAFSNVCTHLGEALVEGFLDGGRIVCAYHGATFEITTGQTVAGPDPPLPVYDVRVEGDTVQVCQQPQS